MNAKDKKIEFLEKLLLKSNEISTFYGKIIDSNAGFLYVHGIKASDEEVQTGKRLRDEFEQLKSELKSLELQSSQKEGESVELGKKIKIPLILSEDEIKELELLRSQKETGFMSHEREDRLLELSLREFGFNMGYDNKFGNLFLLPSGKVVQGDWRSVQSPSEDKIMSVNEILDKNLQPLSPEEMLDKYETFQYKVDGIFCVSKEDALSALRNMASQFSQSQRKVVTDETIIDAGAEYFNNEKTDSNKYVAFREGAKWMRDLLSK